MILNFLFALKVSIIIILRSQLIEFLRLPAFLFVYFLSGLKMLNIIYVFISSDLQSSCFQSSFFLLWSWSSFLSLFPSFYLRLYFLLLKLHFLKKNHFHIFVIKTKFFFFLNWLYILWYFTLCACVLVWHFLLNCVINNGTSR